MSDLAASEPAGIVGPAAAGAEPVWRPPSYWPFVVPAVIVVLAVIIFPWVFTLWMSVHEWKIGAPTA
ncbi:MAG: sugar ABC transporter permease, partial [Microvirga sp.]